MHARNAFGLSTSWNGLKHQSLPGILADADDLGFSRLELYAHFTPEQLAHIRELVANAGLSITSLHNPCPVPVDDVGQRQTLGDWLAALDPRGRSLAVDAARRTIDAAASLGANAVVVHLGRVDLRPRQAEVFAAIRSHGFGSREHRELLAQAVREREERKQPHLEAAIKSAREVGSHAVGTGVTVGLECRDGYFEVPSIEEFDEVLGACRDLPVGYWHDVGHGEKLANAGFIERGELLRRYGSRLVGMHIHDTRMERDHQAPGQGDTDFGALAPHANPSVIRTLELAPSVERGAISRGVGILLEAGFS